MNLSALDINRASKLVEQFTDRVNGHFAIEQDFEEEVSVVFTDETIVIKLSYCYVDGIITTHKSTGARYA